MGLVKEQHRTQARRVLERREFLPEFLFYTTLGRADLILFEAYRQASFLPKASDRGTTARRP
ncbi:MAG TPA: hypothetical protein VHF69_03875 [Candidatus Synoicihabitans sp.]|nr:hypothetical protein [Candidatus Synoicihabitans sp.]